LIDALGKCISNGIPIVFFASGIKEEKSVKALVQSSMSFKTIILPTLKIEHVWKIIENLIPGLTMESCNQFVRHLFSLAGGIPRFVALVLGSLAKVAGSKNLFVVDEVMNVMENMDCSKCNEVKAILKSMTVLPAFPVSKEYYRNLVALHLAEERVTDDTCIGFGTGRPFSILQAQEQGLMYLDKSGRVGIPPLLLSYYYANSAEPQKKLLRLLIDLDGIQSSRENEALVASMIYYRALAKRVVGEMKVDLKHLLGNLSSSIEQIDVSALDSPIVSDIIISRLSIPKLPGFYINTKTASFADAVVVLKRHGEGEKRIVIFIQEKSCNTAKSKSLVLGRKVRPSNDIIALEYQKVNPAMENENLFMYVTDCDDQDEVQAHSDGIQLAKNCLVVCRSDLRALLGSTMSELRRFSLGYDRIDQSEISSRKRKWEP